MFSKWTSSISRICEDVNKNIRDNKLCELISEPNSTGSIIRQLKAIDPVFLQRWKAKNITPCESPAGFQFETNTGKFNGKVEVIKSEKDSTKFNVNFYRHGSEKPEVVSGVFLEDLIRTIDTKIL